MAELDSDNKTTLETVQGLQSSKIHCMPYYTFHNYTSLQKVCMGDGIALIKI